MQDSLTSNTIEGIIYGDRFNQALAKKKESKKKIKRVWPELSNDLKEIQRTLKQFIPHLTNWINHFIFLCISLHFLSNLAGFHLDMTCLIMRSIYKTYTRGLFLSMCYILTSLDLTSSWILWQEKHWIKHSFCYSLMSIFFKCVISFQVALSFIFSSAFADNFISVRFDQNFQKWTLSNKNIAFRCGCTQS